MAFIEVASGVYQVGGNGLSEPDDCCVYLVSCGEEAVLVDTGTGPAGDLIYKNIISTGINPQLVRNIIITHGHIDHIGNLAWMKDRLAARVTAHQLELPAIQEGKPQLTAAAYYGVDYQPVEVENVIIGEQKIIFADKEFECLFTPGHTPGSMSILTRTGEDKILFGQDIHGPFSSIWGSNLGDWKHSMYHLLDREADILCEGHFGIIRGRNQVTAFIQGYLNQYARRDR
ncbi:MAG: MBL fold metallo-hydrolase [Methylocystaceae bacterium]